MWKASVAPGGGLEEGAGGGGRMMTIYLSGRPGLHPGPVFRLSLPTKAACAAARILHFDSLVPELFLEAL